MFIPALQAENVQRRGFDFAQQISAYALACGGVLPAGFNNAALSSGDGIQARESARQKILHQFWGDIITDKLNEGA